MNPKDNYTHKQVLVVATFGSANPERCPAPFMFVGEAVKAGAEAGICFILQAPQLLKRGVAETLRPRQGGGRSASSSMMPLRWVSSSMSAMLRCNFAR